MTAAGPASAWVVGSGSAMLEQTILTLVRHGQTSANQDGVWHGSSDTPLTAHGERQAERVAEFLSGAPHREAVVVYASPLQRACHTARPIAERLGLEVRVEPDLAEYDIGAWEGMSFRELHEVHGLWEKIASDPDFAPHGGESPRQVATRMAGCLRRIAEAHPRQRVIAVSHGGALAIGLAALLAAEPAGAGAPGFTRVMRNCGVSELVIEPRPELLCFDLDGHLEGL